MTWIHGVKIIAANCVLAAFACSAGATTQKVFDSVETELTSIDFRFASNRLPSPIRYERAGVFSLDAPQTLTGFTVLAKALGDARQFSDQIFPLTISFFDNSGPAPATSPLAARAATSLRFEMQQISGENAARISGDFDEVDLMVGSYLFLVQAATREFELIGRLSQDGSEEFGRDTSDGEWEPYAAAPAELDFELYGLVRPIGIVPAPEGFGLLLAALFALFFWRRASKAPSTARSAICSNP